MDEAEVLALVDYYAQRRAARPTCRRCGRSPANRPRGLCWACYYTPGVREQYPSTSKYARQGAGLGNAARRPPDAPTSAEPGSPAKVEVLAARAAAGVGLFHKDDAGPGASTPCRFDPLRPHGAELRRLVALAVARGWSLRDAVLELQRSPARVGQLLAAARAAAVAEVAPA